MENVSLLIRQCPSCDATIKYKHRQSYLRAIRRNQVCDGCRMKRLRERQAIVCKQPGYRKYNHDRICDTCHKAYKGHIHQRFCSKKCRYITLYVNADPITKRAITMSGYILFGRGKKAYFEKLIREHLGKPCRYCNVPLRVETMSCDHIQPFGSLANRKDKILKAQMDRTDNLQIICKKCNTLKGNLNHQDFALLLEFLSEHPFIKTYVLNKLGQSTFIYSQRARTKK